MAKSTPAILVVCTANVCRSALAGFLLEEDFSGEAGFESVAVATAGVRPARSLGVCELVAERRSDERWRGRAKGHRPSAITPHKLRAARLILTASRSSRGAVARMAPDVRARTFTLNEAVLLGAGYQRDPSLAGDDAVEAFATYLDAQRGLRLLAAPPGRFPWSRAAADPVTIQDGHNADAKAHAATIVSVEQAAHRIAAMITGAPVASQGRQKREPALT